MQRPRVEWPTVFVACGVYVGFLALTLGFHELPWWVVAIGGGLVVAWHGSLQHEVVHGHPTRWRRVNDAIGAVPLSLWVPLAIYRHSHLAHHRSRDLTHPAGDPESFHLTQGEYDRLSAWQRALVRAAATLFGRLLFGPPIVVGRFLWRELRRAFRDPRHRRVWLSHAAAVAALMAWVIGVCGIPLWEYLLSFVYPGISLTLLRSYAEHRPAPDNAHASAIVEACFPLSLVFLNNNLHALHHAEPSRPWYELPRRYRELEAEILEGNGGYRFDGYLDVVRRYAFRAKAPVVHPDHAAASPERETC